MPVQAFVIGSVISVTLLGDYFIKRATLEPSGLTSLSFSIGVAAYGLSAIGWFYLMKSHSLTTISVLFSASMLILLPILGRFIFLEPFRSRDVIGVGLALLAIIVMKRG